MKKNEKFAKNIIPAIALNVSYGKNMNISQNVNSGQT